MLLSTASAARCFGIKFHDGSSELRCMGGPMNRIDAKSVVLVLLLASFLGAPYLSPEDPGSGAADRSRFSVMGSQAPLGPGGPKRVDFNGDGYEDILWRYYGTGGSNRVWFLGSAEGTRPSGAVEPGITANAAGKSPSKARTSKQALVGKRDMGLTPKRKGRAQVKDPEFLMGGLDRRNTGSAMVQDPRQAGGGSYEFSRIVVTDPRQVGATAEALGAAPPLQGGADVLPVGDPNWQIVGAADFNNDTQTDILWRNVSTGQNVLWYMNGADWSSSAELIPIPDQSWQIVGTGDFNNDTHVDILWRNIADGTNVVWYMNGAEWSSSAVLLGVGDLDWQIVGTGDFNNDTHVDILWRYYGTGGSNVVWYMDNAGWIGSAELIPVADLNWQIMGTGDYNDDGNVDILWRYNGEGGTNVIWYMDGASWAGSAELLPVSDLSWKVAGRGAFADRYQPFETTLDPSGGSYFFPNGITLEVPAGAVSVPTTVATRLVRYEQANAVLQRYGEVTKTCLAAFEALPAGLHFNLPIKARLHARPLPSLYSMPLHFIMDLENLLYEYAQTVVTFNRSAGTAEFDLQDLSTHAITAAELTGQSAVGGRSAAQDPWGGHSDCATPETACRCQRFFVQEQSMDIIVNGECHFAQVMGHIVYIDCGNLTESWKFTDIDFGKIVVTSPTATIKVGKEPATLSAQVFRLSGPEVADAQITFSSTSDCVEVVNYAALKQAHVFGKKCGKAPIRVEAGCGNHIYVDVDVQSEVVSVAVDPPTAAMGLNADLNLRAILFNDEGEDDETLKDPVEWVSADPAIVSVTGNGRYARAHSYHTDEEVTVMITAKSGCESMHSGYAFITVKPLSVEISPDVVAVGIGEVKPLTVTVKDSEGNIIEDPPITWQTSAIGIVDVPAPGDIRGVSGGWAWISATCQGVSGWALAGVPTVGGKFVVTKVLSDAESNTSLSSINNVGQVVGTYSNGGEHGFIYDHQNGYEWLGEVDTQPEGINDLGQIVGVRGSPLQGYFYDSGVFLPIDIGFFARPTAVNNLGQAVGWYVDAGHHGFLYHDGQVLTVNYPNFYATYCDDINDNGMIVGTIVYVTETGSVIYSGFLYDSLSLNFEFSTEELYGINNAGNLIAYAVTADQWFYREGPNNIQIDMGQETWLEDINDFDQIVGEWEGDAANEIEYAFILTPCPFPWALGPGIYPPFIPLRPIVPGGYTGSGIGEGTPVVQMNGHGTVSGRAIPKRKSGISK
jgi:uncharacterized protein YjdB